MPYKDPEVQRQAQREYYLANSGIARQRSQEQRNRKRVLIDELKSAPCMDCGNSYPPFVMDFHHRDPTTKIESIGNLIRLVAWSRVMDEIAKCDLICANCHRIREYKKLAVA